MHNALDHEISIGLITDKFTMPTETFLQLQIVFFPLI